MLELLSLCISVRVPASSFVTGPEGSRVPLIGGYEWRFGTIRDVAEVTFLNVLLIQSDHRCWVPRADRRALLPATR
jgi:hypothetical protein